MTPCTRPRLRSRKVSWPDRRLDLCRAVGRGNQKAGAGLTILADEIALMARNRHDGIERPIRIASRQRRDGLEYILKVRAHYPAWAG
jgi:hypothetical protein